MSAALAQIRRGGVKLRSVKADRPVRPLKRQGSLAEVLRDTMARRKQLLHDGPDDEEDDDDWN